MIHRLNPPIGRYRAFQVGWWGWWYLLVWTRWQYPAGWATPVFHALHLGPFEIRLWPQYPARTQENS